MKQFSDTYTDSDYDTDISMNRSDEHSQSPTLTSVISQLQTSPFINPTKRPPSASGDQYRDDEEDIDETSDISSFSTKDFNNYLRASTAINIPLKEVLVTIPLDITKPDFIANEKSSTDDSIHGQSTVSSLYQRNEDISDTNIISSTLSSNDLSELKDHSLITEFNSTVNDNNATPHSINYDRKKIIQDDDNNVNFPLFSMKFKSTMDPQLSQITSEQPLLTNVENIASDETSKAALKHPTEMDTHKISSDSITVHDDNVTNIASLAPVIAVNQSIQNITLQNQSNLNGTTKLYDTLKDHLYEESSNITRTSTLSTLISNDTVNLITTSEAIKKTIQDEINYKHSSTISVDVNVSSTLQPLSPFLIFNTTLFSSYRSRLSSALHHSPSYSSTESPKFTEFSSLKYFSGKPKPKPPFSEDMISIDSEMTTELSDSSILSSSTTTVLQSSYISSSMQTTNALITSDILKQKPITTLSHMSSPPVTTHHPRFISTISSTSFLITDEQPLKTEIDHYSSKSPETYIELSSLPDVKSTEILHTNYQSTPITVTPSIHLDSFSTIISDKISKHSIVTPTDHRPPETTKILQLSSASPSSFTNKYQEEFSSTEPSFGLTSTSVHSNFDITYSSTQSSSTISLRTSYSSTRSTTTTTPSTILTTTSRYRTRKVKTTPWQTQRLSTTSTTTTTIIPVYRTTSINGMLYIFSLT